MGEVRQHNESILPIPPSFLVFDTMDLSPLQGVKSLKQVLERQATYMTGNMKLSGNTLDNEVVLDEGRLPPIHKDIYFLVRREGRNSERILDTLLRRLIERN